MKIAITGGTGFIGRYIIRQLAAAGHELQCWYRPESDRSGLDDVRASIRWIPGQLDEGAATRQLVEGCDAVVHSALDRPGAGFRGSEGDLIPFVQKNVLGTLRLILAAQQQQVQRFIFLSTCAVHERILPDRPLDETHPLWPTSHYGAHKAALEKFVHSFGMGQGMPICALRPTGVYGVAHPVQRSKWYELVRRVVRGETVQCARGGKEVHAHDVARAVQLLLQSDGIAGEAYNCYDRYVSEFEVATLAQRLSSSNAQIQGQPTSPKNQIETGKLRGLGMEFGGEALLEETIAELVGAAQAARDV